MPVQKCTEKSSCIATPPPKKKKNICILYGPLLLFCFFLKNKTNKNTILHIVINKSCFLNI